MVPYFKILSYLALVFILIGCSKELSFEELTKDVPPVPNLQSHSSIKMKYSISLLKRLKLVEEVYDDTSGFELFIDTSMTFEKGVSMLSIYKYNSTEVALDIAWNKLISNRQLIENFRIHSEGSTNYLSRPAYYEHSAFTISGKEVESISFFLHGDFSSFFLVTLQVNTEGGYPENMKELLFCVKSIDSVTSF